MNVALDLETFKNLIGLDEDEEAYDELITSALEFNVEDSDKLHFLATMCHLERVAPEIGAIVKSHRLDDFSEDYKIDDTETWCQTYNRIKNEEMEAAKDDSFAVGLGSRAGTSNDFSNL